MHAMKKPLHAPLVIAALALYGFGSVAHAGDPLKGLTDMLANGTAKALEGALNKKPADSPTRDGQEARNGTRTNDEGGGGRPNLSELRDEDFRQNDSSPAPDPNNTRIRVAGNLMIDIAGHYPNGYQPAWRFISKPSPLSVKIENWAHPQSKVRHSDFNLFIGDYGGKAVIRFKAEGGFDKECFADIVIKNAPVVLASNPQVFELANFRRILNDRATGEDCAFSSSPGGWGGRIALSANGNGDVLMDLMMESYTVQRQVGKKVYPAQVQLRHIATGITVENEMSAAKAIAVVAAEQEAKQRLKASFAPAAPARSTSDVTTVKQGIEAFRQNAGYRAGLRCFSFGFRYGATKNKSDSEKGSAIAGRTLAYLEKKAVEYGVSREQVESEAMSYYRSQKHREFGDAQDDEDYRYCTEIGFIRK